MLDVESLDLLFVTCLLLLILLPISTSISTSTTDILSYNVSSFFYFTFTFAFFTALFFFSSFVLPVNPVTEMACGSH